MKNFFLPAVALFMLAGCSNSKKANNGSQTSEAGFSSLFDGKTTNGWHTYGRETAGKIWEVKDGALYLNAANRNKVGKAEGGDLVTNEEYENFHLKFDWKISEKGNSGVIFLIQENPKIYGATYQTGPEYQVLDNGTPTRLGHSDAKIYTHRAGDLYDLLAAEEAVNPVGEWNEAEIRLLKGKLDFYLNGKHTLSTTLWDDNWNAMVEISKFKDMPGFGKSRKGKIAFQDHGDEVWYRNIRIKRL